MKVFLFFFGTSLPYFLVPALPFFLVPALPFYCRFGTANHVFSLCHKSEKILLNILLQEDLQFIHFSIINFLLRENFYNKFFSKRYLRGRFRFFWYQHSRFIDVLAL